MGLGGDLGGSIRIPSHFSGIHGLKPTSGRLTNGGVPGYLFATGQEAILAQPGPMARSVSDLSLAMRVLTSLPGGATIDQIPPVPWREPNGSSLVGLKVGFFFNNDLIPASPALRRAVREAAEALEREGAIVESFTPPSAAEATRIFLAIMSADGGKGMKRLLDGEPPHQIVKGLLQGAGRANPLRPLIASLSEGRGQSHLAFLLRSTGTRSAAEYWELVDDRTAYRERYLIAMNEAGLDAILCPPFALPAIKHGSSEHLVAAASYAFPFNVTGMPAGVVAATRVQDGEETDRAASRDLTELTARDSELGSAGLPVGVQVVGRHW